MITLVEKKSEDRAKWFEHMWADYRESMVGAGARAESADQNIRGHQERLFVGGELVAGQYLYDIVEAGRAVGTMWIAQGPESDPGTWFIYDIVIDEDQRGRGLGRGAMEAAERLAGDAGATRLSLNVFGPNTVARALYESLGYSVMATSMFKAIGD